MISFIDLTDHQATPSDSQNNQIESLQINTITQSLTPLLNDSANIDPSKINKKRTSQSICKIASLPNPILVSKFFYYCFGYNNMCFVPHITSDLVTTVGSDLENHFCKKLNDFNDEEEFITYAEKFGISATYGCIRRLIFSGTDGYINDEAITIFIDAMNFHLGHRKNILKNSSYFILDSICANNFVLINEETAIKNEYTFPNKNPKFSSYIHQQIEKGYLNKPVQDIFMLDQEERPNILGCLNIMNQHNKHFYMFEYDFNTNKVTTTDSKHDSDNDDNSDYKYERMWLAKSFGLMRSIHERSGKNIYCGGRDMYPNGFNKS